MEIILYEIHTNSDIKCCSPPKKILAFLKMLLQQLFKKPTEPQQEGSFLHTLHNFGVFSH